ncbi:TIGR04282 family arsenosugar biosynthesis glycosyltransferase [Phaeodactylibacter luteus]|uniref:DUF2064 domain-containing protein n=1 Tax=Phaeodactylibacter luteus TaxID=1564516 RepID=A0A5C6RHH7_9BACT|nr:DUF2064 domain-containing protein [Phaeodactylibacter luteus]TXB61553.1 DUF2064 domain-containing protein [Phaeodactylibacter luteus]
MPRSATAILFFSRSASCEARAKGFGLVQKKAKRLAKALINRARQTVERSGLDVVNSDERSQRGHTFGQKLSNAVADVFRSGYQQVIIIGNDCPGITPAEIGRAAQLLEEGHQVLAPDQNGGVWLIGLRKGAFAPAAFAEVAWESEQTFAGLRQLLSGVTLLPPHRSVEKNTDLRFFWQQHKSWLYLVAELLFEAPLPHRNKPAAQKTAPLHGQLSQRGPPQEPLHL